MKIGRYSTAGGERLLTIMETANNTLLVAANQASEVVGLIQVYWEHETTVTGACGHFGMLSVAKSHEKRGIGKMLVTAAERRIHS